MADFVKVDDALGKFAEGSAIDTSAGAADGGKMVKTLADGTIDPTLLPQGIGDDVQTKTAGEAISNPAIVRIDSGGNAVNADASLANGAGAGIAFVKEAIADGATGKIYYEGISSGWSGLTVGLVCFLGEIAGQVTHTPVTTSGHLLQPLGVAVSDSEIAFEAGQGVIRG